MRKLLCRLGMSVFALVAFGLLPFGAKALTISPPLIDHQLDPGNTVLEVIKIYNEDEFPITVYPLLRNFTASDKENGEPRFLPPEVDDNGTGLAKWVTIDTQPLTIAPKQRTNLPLAINVPGDALPGGHYGAVILSTEPPTSSTGIGVAQQLGSLMLIRISGEVVEDGRIAEFSFQKPKVWYNHLPVDFSLRFENNGNTHLRPTGNLFIYNMFGKQVASIQVNDSYRSVLPRSIRKFDFGWQKAKVSEEEGGLMKEWKNFAIGKHKAVLVLYYGNDNKMVTDTRTFTVWPWRLMTMAGAALLILIGLIVLLFKAYKRSIIAKMEKLGAKKSDKKADKAEREKLEQELREKLEKEMRQKLEKEMKQKPGSDKPEDKNKGDSEDKPHTELPPELRAE